MIVDKRDILPDGSTTAIPADAPPSYVDTLQVSSDPFPPRGDEKSPQRAHPSPPSSQRPNAPQAKAFPFKFWPSSRTTKQVRTTVLGLVRDLVREQPIDGNGSAPIGILRSCYDACMNNELCLSSLLQEKCIEGHTALYWAVLKRKPDEEITDDTAVPDLLTVLLSFAAPLEKEAISEIRVACLLNSDQLLFQRLRMTAEFSSVRPSDEMLLGEGIPPDNIWVEDVPGDEGAFVAYFEIVRFQKRMWVTKEIVLEFIARSRLWRLAFVIMPDGYAHHGAPKPGSWCVKLSMEESSAPTWIDSRFIVHDPQLPWQPCTDMNEQRGGIAVRLGSSKQLATASTKRYQRDVDSEIVVSLEASLQYAGSSYIGRDETLRARFETRLAKPDSECIIC